MRILIADKFEKFGQDALAALGATLSVQPDVTPQQLVDSVKQFDPHIIIVRSKKVQAPAIAAALSLKGIIRAGAGFDNIDLAAARSRSIDVCNCPGTNSVAVAELVMGLLISCDRRIPDQTAELRSGQWNKGEYTKSRGLKGSTLCIIGAGAIGREVTRRAKAFGMHVIAHSLNMTRDRAQDLGVEYGGRTREELLALLPRCDAVSIMVAANKESEKLCDARFFAAMKPGAYFINTSRGSVVDESALRDAIASKNLRAGLDVFEDEPAESKTSWTTRTASLPGVYTTHHIGASTDQAQAAVAEEVVRLVKLFQTSGHFENIVN